MPERIDAKLAKTQLDQIMDRAVASNERFIVERNGEAAVVIISAQDYIDNLDDSPEWMKQAWADAKANGTDKMTMDEINTEIDAYRAEKRTAAMAIAK